MGRNARITATGFTDGPWATNLRKKRPIDLTQTWFAGPEDDRRPVTPASPHRTGWTSRYPCDAQGKGLSHALYRLEIEQKPRSPRLIFLLLPAQGLLRPGKDFFLLQADLKRKSDLNGTTVFLWEYEKLETIVFGSTHKGIVDKRGEKCSQSSPGQHIGRVML